MDFITLTKGNAVGFALEQVTDKKPVVQDMGDHIKIYWKDEDIPAITKKINDIISRKEKGDIRVDWMPVVAPIAIKKALPYAIGILVVGYVLGKAI